MNETKAQSSGFSYQVILESRNQYNALDDESIINKKNQMGMDEFSSLTQVYPIGRFIHQMGELSSILQVEGKLSNYNFAKDSTDFTFQELYSQFSYKEQHHIVIGKKRLDWGTGVLWNPTNFYIQKDPLRTQNRLEGKFQLAYTYLLTAGSIQAYIFPEKKIKDFSYAVKYDLYGERIDASISFLQYQKHQQFGVDFSYGGDLFTAYGESVLRNYSKSYKVDMYGNTIPPIDKKDRFRLELVIGGSMIINSHISFRGEYRFREDYLSRKDILNYKQHLSGNTVIYDPISMGKHSLFGSLEWKDLYDVWSLQMRTFYDPLSRQLILSPLAIWRKNNFQVELSGMVYNNAFSVFDFQGSLLLSCHF